MFYSQDKKAIPTTYAEIKMRSVLEVRWAVYFDFLGIKWIYEPGTLKIPGHKSYKPDFYLVDQKVFMEVKPEAFDWDDRHKEFAKLYRVSLAICRGLPGMAKQSFMRPTETIIEMGDSHFFSKKCNDLCGHHIPLDWFYKILWTWVKTHPIVAGGINRKVNQFYLEEMAKTYNIMLTRGDTSKMEFAVAKNQCPKCRKFDTYECNESGRTYVDPYCNKCGYKF